MWSSSVMAASDADFDVALLALRVIFGLFIAAHGVAKIRGGIAGTAGWFASIGMRQPRLQARAAAGTEIGAGVALAIGVATPLAAAAIVGVMFVAFWVAHRTTGFFIYNNGWEYTASIAAVAVVLGITGPGRISLDAVLGLDIDGILAGVGVLALGVVAAGVQLAAFYRPAPAGEDS